MHEVDSSLVFADGKQQISFVWNSRTPFVQRKPNESFTWEGSNSIQTKGYVSKHAKSGGTNGLLHLGGDRMSNSVTENYQDSSGFFLSRAKGVSEVLNQGLSGCLLIKLPCLYASYAYSIRFPS